MKAEMMRERRPKAEERSAKVISFYNYKGGTGKTKLAVNVAAWLAKDITKRVLFIDMDAQCSADISYLGFDQDTLGGDPAEYKNILNVPGINIKKHNVSIKKLPIKDLITKAPHFGLYAIKGSFSQDDYWTADNSLDGKLDIMLEAIDTIRDRFDYIIFDLGPRDNLPTLNALTASDYVLSVLDCETASITGAERFFKKILPACKQINPLLRSLGIVANRYKQSSYNLYSIDMHGLAVTYNTHLFECRIRESSGFYNQTNWDFIEKAKTGRPVVFYDKYFEKNYNTAFMDMRGFVMEFMYIISILETAEK